MTDGQSQIAEDYTLVDVAGDSPDGHHDECRPTKRPRGNQSRQRVTRACDKCKSRKTRCSGKHPCTYCVHYNLECRFTAAYRRGRLPSIEIDNEATVTHMTHASNPLQSPESLENSLGTPSISRHEEVAQPTSDLTVPDPTVATSAVQSSRNSPEPSQSDRQGHYVGPSSGVSFLLRIQRKIIHQQSSCSADSSIFTFGDRSLPESDPSLFILPAHSEARDLVNKYFGFASATHRYLHQPSVEQWLIELYDSNGSLALRKRPGSESRLAVLFMVFAQADVLTRTIDAGRADDSSRFFYAAERQLSAEKGEIRLTSIQARIAQCLYLLSQSRINHCWTLFGTTAHLIFALGIHRKRRLDPQNVDHVSHECRKRTFWCAYNLDTYLSTSLGRPRTFHDEDIDQDMPLCLNDIDLSKTQAATGPTTSQSLMSGAVAHHKLTRIIANILRDFYGIRPPTSANRVLLAEKYRKQLLDWKAPLASFLDSTGVDVSLFLPVYLRQRNVLNLALWHAQILLHRPFLLNNFAGLDRANSNTLDQGSSGPEVSRNIQECLDAAMSIVKHVDNMNSTNQLYSTYYFTQYFCFCAVVVIYVYAIQQRSAPPAKYLEPFEMASKCQNHLSHIALSHSFAERYGVILEELRIEVLRRNIYLAQRYPSSTATYHNATSFDPAAGIYGHTQVSDNTIKQPPASIIPGMNGLGDLSVDGFNDLSPDSYLDQMTGWGNFDALVSGGLGNIEGLFQDNLDT